MLQEIRNLNKAFGAVTVADDISLDVAEGETLGIIGPNGAGKSTLFNLITGRVAPGSGTIWLDGTDITRLPARRRVHRGIARSFQIPQPFEQMTTYENVSVAACFGAGGSELAEQGHVVEVLHRTDLLAKANLPAGSLSLLERKRLEMARALATKPRLLLLDEIAGGLTDAECISLVETIRQINADGTTIVWIEHVTHALLAVVTRLVALDFGKIIGEGDPEAVMASDAVRRIYLGMEV